MGLVPPRSAHAVEQTPYVPLPSRPSQLRSATERWWNRELDLSNHVVLAGICAFAVLLRFLLLGHNSLWFDEAFTNHVTQARWTDIFSMLRLGDAHPPLYYLLMKAWVQLAGHGETALRIPSAGFSALSVPLVYLLARRVTSGSGSLLAALMISVSPAGIMSGQEARMYPLLGFLALASTLALTVCVTRGGVLRWAGYVVLATLMPYTHYLGIFVLGAQGLWVACCERRHLAKWLAAGAVVTVLYAPWIPSLWYQTSHGHGWTWYRLPVSYEMLGDVLTLFAFGGTLFGTASYFAEGALSPLETLIVLLPFLIVLWWGIVSLSKDRRALALIALPLIVPIGAMFLISLVKPMFYARWFSFLSPFYAVLLAQGIVAVAGEFHGRRDRAVALITIGLLLYSVPVLGRYYLDPAFRVYNWRAAAALIEKQGRPGDFFLYDNSAAKIAFTYYFSQPHPSLQLAPVEALPGKVSNPTFNKAWVQRLAAKYPRMWVVATVPFTPEMQRRLQSDLQVAYRPVEARNYQYIWITLLEAKNIRSP